MSLNGKNKRICYFVCGILLCSVLIGVAYLLLDKDDGEVKIERIRVKVLEVGMENRNGGGGYAAEIRSQYETELAFQVGGRISDRRVKLGDRVERGDVLAVLDTRDLIQSQRNVQAQDASIESQLKLAEKNLMRYKNLLAQGAVSQAAYDSYEQQYEGAVAAMEQSQAQLQESANQIGYSMLVADRAGVITKLKAEPGQIVSAGENVVAIADEQSLEVDFSLSEAEIGKLSVGQNVMVKLNQKDKESYQAVVREIAPMADAATRTFLVKAGIKDFPKDMRLGMTAQVNAMFSDGQKCYIPRSAIVDKNGMGVWIEENGLIHFRAIQLGENKEDMVEVVSGLDLGEKIVTAGVQKLHEGDCVEVM